jgi:hypothetical protein
MNSQPLVKNPSGFKGPEAHQPPPERRKAIEMANLLVETGRLLSNLRYRTGEDTPEVNRKIFTAVEARLKKLRKSLPKLEVEYNRKGLL